MSLIHTVLIVLVELLKGRARALDDGTLGQQRSKGLGFRVSEPEALDDGTLGQQRSWGSGFRVLGFGFWSLGSLTTGTL